MSAAVFANIRLYSSSIFTALFLRVTVMLPVRMSAGISPYSVVIATGVDSLSLNVISYKGEPHLFM